MSLPALSLLQGILHARGALLLFADADGATRFADLSLLCAEVARIQTPAGHAVVVGSRAHLVGSEAVVKVCACRYPSDPCVRSRLTSDL